ncbi:UNVERIFIED_CONTAM: hypothetical protein K2H54_025706 [Gekko kuhli]
MLHQQQLRESFLKKEQAEIAAAESEKEKDEPKMEVGAATEQISPEAEGSTAVDQSSSPEVENNSTAERSSSPQTEEEAAVILQCNYRGYRERKKVKEQCKKKAEKQPSTKQSFKEAKKSIQNKVQGADQNDVAAAHVPSISHGNLDRKASVEDKEILPPAGKSSMKQKPPRELSEEDKNQAVSSHLPQKASIKKASQSNKQIPLEISGTDEKSHAAIVTQDSHMERGSLKHGRIIPCENKGCVRKGSMRGSQKHTEASKQSSADKEKAALVIQSNYRGYRKRGQLKKEGKLPCGNQEGKGGGHSQNLGSKSVKERRSSSAHSEGHKNILKDGSEKEKSDLAAFSRQISKLSEDYLLLQQKLNEMILSHQLRPVKLSKEKQMNGHLSPHVHQPVEVFPPLVKNFAEESHWIHWFSGSPNHGLLELDVTASDDSCKRGKGDHASPHQFNNPADLCFKGTGIAVSYGSQALFKCTASLTAPEFTGPYSPVNILAVEALGYYYNSLSEDQVRETYLMAHMIGLFSGN